MTAPAETLDAHARLGRAIRSDSLWLFSGYAVTAAIGFVFWIVAALRVAPDVLGADAALISVVSAAGAVTSSGIGSSMVVMLPGAGRLRGFLVRRALASTLVVGAVVGAVAGLLAGRLLNVPGDTVVLVAAITAMTICWAVFNIEDQMFAGLGRARWTLFVNGPANLAKLALTLVLTLPLLAVPHPVLQATIYPAAAAVLVSVLVLLPRFLAADEPAEPAIADVRVLVRAFGVFAVRDSLAIGLLLGAGLLTPFLVTALAGPVQGALYALAYQFSVALDQITVGFATSLAKHASTDRAGSVAMAFRLWRQVFVVVLAGGVLVTVATPVMFGLLGRGYDPVLGAAVVGLLAAGSVVRSVYSVWSSLLRAERRVVPVLVSNAACAVLLVALLVALVPVLGAAGGALAVLASAGCSALIGTTGLLRLRRDVVPTPGRYA
ncbi:hypothetical protein [Propionicimonas sp.]|uniref:hypothetical protein n=1 Tax=Propionicimonas sp. TaxID=1955623 RepID=UPI0039E702BC